MCRQITQLSPILQVFILSIAFYGNGRDVPRHLGDWRLVTLTHAIGTRPPVFAQQITKARFLDVFGDILFSKSTAEVTLFSYRCCVMSTDESKIKYILPQEILLCRGLHALDKDSKSATV